MCSCASESRVRTGTDTYVEGDLGKNRGRVKGGRSQKEVGVNGMHCVVREGKYVRLGAGTIKYRHFLFAVNDYI